METTNYNINEDGLRTIVNERQTRELHMAKRSSLIILSRIWCLSSVGVGILKEALDRACPH